jgi:hypothetical protein
LTLFQKSEGNSIPDKLQKVFTRYKYPHNKCTHTYINIHAPAFAHTKTSTHTPTNSHTNKLIDKQIGRAIIIEDREPRSKNVCKQHRKHKASNVL